MITAAEMRAGMALRMEGHVYRVLSAEVHQGGGKMGGVVHARLEDIDTGGKTDRRFRPDERVEELELRRRSLTFLYRDGDTLNFMDSESYEQIPVAAALLGELAAFVQENATLPVEFFEERPVRVVLPDLIEVKVKTTAPPMKQGEQSTWKEATLENGLEIQVPLFIAPGDTIRLEVAHRRYVERVRDKGKS